MVEKGTLIRAMRTVGEAEKGAIYPVYSSDNGFVNVDKGGGRWIYKLSPEDYTIVNPKNTCDWAKQELAEVDTMFKKLLKDKAVNSELESYQVELLRKAQEAYELAMYNLKPVNYD